MVFLSGINVALSQSELISKVHSVTKACTMLFRMSRLNLQSLLHDTDDIGVASSMEEHHVVVHVLELLVVLHSVVHLIDVLNHIVPLTSCVDHVLAK